MKKLKFYGIVGNACALINLYLSDWYQRVLSDDKLTHSYTSSEWGNIKRGVRQGSVLVPILFLLYINDLPKVVNYNCKLVFFPGETSIIVSNTIFSKL
jgi:hypothetical protein